MQKSRSIRMLASMTCLTLVSSLFHFNIAHAATAVTTCEQFRDMALIGGDYVLASDLDCSYLGNDVIVGNSLNPFRGLFDGASHTITVNIMGEDYAAPFAQLWGATVHDLNISGAIHGSQYVGGLAGEMRTDSEISNISSDAVISGSRYVGGLVGLVQGTDTGNRSTIEESEFTGTVSAVAGVNANEIGGLVGWANSANITGNTVTADITIDNGGDYTAFGIGGLLGSSDGYVLIDSNDTDVQMQIGIYGSTVVLSASSIGGAVGYINSDTVISNSSSAGDIHVVTTNGGEYIGGFAGVICESGPGCDVDNATSDTNITIVRNNGAGFSDIGGFGGAYNGLEYVGDSWVHGMVDNIVTTGDIDVGVFNGGYGVYRVGGIFGAGNGLDLYNVEATGSIEVGPFIEVGEFEVGSIGGFVGESDSLSVYNSATVDGGDITVNAQNVYDVGGVVGYVDSALILEDVQVERGIHINESYSGNEVIGVGGIVGSTNSIDASDYTTTSGATGIGGEGGTDNIANIGGIVGYTYSSSYLDDVKSFRDITLRSDNSLDAIGGIAGTYCDSSYDCSMFQVAHEGDMIMSTQGVSDIGGLAGLMDSGEGDRIIEQSYSKGDMSINVFLAANVNNVGGIGGELNNIELQNVYANGNIDINTLGGEGSVDVTNIGGLAGYFDSGLSINSVYYTGDIGLELSEIDHAYNIGGLLGESYFYELNNSFASNTFTISGGDTVSYSGIGGYAEIDNLNTNYYGDSAGEIGCTNGLFDIPGCTQIDNYGEAVVDFMREENEPFAIDDGGPVQIWDNEVIWYFSRVAYPIFFWSMETPEVTTMPADTITQTAAQLNGQIDYDGSAPVDEYGFEYGLTVEYEDFVFESGEGPYSEQGYSLGIEDLTCGTEYHYRIYAHNFAGNGYGEDETFTTLDCPSGGGRRDPSDPMYLSPDPENSVSGPSTPVGDHDGMQGEDPGENPVQLPSTGPSPWNGNIETVDAVAPNTYIKGTNYDTIYFVVQDGNHLVRRPFINETIFATYESSFDHVQTVTDATLPFLKIGSPMLPKPGSVFVKLESVAKTYATFLGTTPKPVARWIQTEADATTFAGPSWADYVIDIPVTLYQGYEMGANLVKEDAGLIQKGLLRLRVSLKIK